MPDRVFQLRINFWRSLLVAVIFFTGGVGMVFIAIQIYSRGGLGGIELWFVMLFHGLVAVIAIWITFCIGELCNRSRKNLLIITVSDKSAVVPQITLLPFLKKEVPLEQITRIAQIKKKSAAIFWGKMPFQFWHVFRFNHSVVVPLEWFQSRSEAAEFINLISKKSGVLFEE